jgi:hypothetical protein
MLPPGFALGFKINADDKGRTFIEIEFKITAAKFFE